MGGSKVSVPGPSAEERALQQQQAELLKFQTEILKQQQQQQKVLLPFLAQQEGYSVTMDENGNISAISKQDTPLETQNKEIQALLNQRSLDALHGNLPVDPALESSLQSQEQQMKEALASKFGPGYETTSAGIETLGNFMKNAEQLRYGARTGQLTLAEQLGLTRQQQESFERESSQNILQTAAFGNPMTIAGAAGQVASGYGRAQQPYIQQRQMQMQASQSNAAGQMGLFGAGISALGSLAMFSDPDLKDDLTLISHTKHGLPIYEYTRKDTGERMLGVLSTDVEELFPEVVGRRAGYDVVEYGAL